jgi:cyanate permease
MDAPTRGTWLALMVFFSLVAGGVVGLLAWAGGDNPFAAVLAGGAGFGGTFLLLVAVVHFATSASKTVN